MKNFYQVAQNVLRSIRRKSRGLYESEPGAGVLRAQERLHSIRRANASIPRDEVFTRQQRRAEERAEAKDRLSQRKKLAMRHKWMGGAAAVRFDNNIGKGLLDGQF